MDYYMHFLFLLETLALTETWNGSHCLRYFHTVVTRSEFRELRFISVGYVDDQQFLRLDSDSASQRMEPLEPWIEKINQEDQDLWKQRTQMCKSWTYFYLKHLENVSAYFNQSKDGVHIYQRMLGCEVSTNGGFKRGFEQDAYDGHDYIALDTETSTWTAAVPEAVNTKRKWEAERGLVEGKKAYLEEECVWWLNKLLEKGKEALNKTDPPSLRVTRHTAAHGKVTLMCWAQDFYPSKISLTWLKDGEEQLQDTEIIETRPAGDGTFQKWAAVSMTSGQEGKYTCRVQHEGLSEPLSLKWESESSSSSIIMGAIAIVLFIAIAGVVIWRKNSGGIGGDYA